jgi:hypothetical protein
MARKWLLYVKKDKTEYKKEQKSEKERSRIRRVDLRGR